MYVVVKGVVVVPNMALRTGPWLGATRRPSLQRVANRPIICHVLDAMAQASVLDVAIVAPRDASEEIAATVAAEGPAGVAVRHLLAEGEHGSLAAAAEFVGADACVLHRANGLLGQPLAPYIELAESEHVDALLLLDDDRVEARRLKLVSQQLSGNGDGNHAASGRGGVCVLGAGSLSRLAALADPPRPQELSALAERLAGEGGRVEVRTSSRWRQFAGDALELLEMNRAILDTLDDEATPGAEDGNRFEGPISIHPTACVTDSVINGPVVIGAEAYIADSYIGPHTSIAERVRIEGSELERSIVLADASVLHVGGRLVASVVGRRARVFRDFSIPRAMRLQVGDGDEVALC